ncbi:uncharacterized protein MJAP1_003446 [Malassezia japonica]|uniref:Ankyrin n=1 Tax=Malassezia japonica TaxID=223818 RepID=A0AAF0F428_9BASI|nr:uncharacterized protein MJAP1_003446 [Malassezia japonica]WFD40460.1 hypothetical protein MJAP1_003446 [Malassezia japonica]
MPAPVPSQEEIAAKVREGPNVWIAAGDGDLDRVKLLLEHGGVTPTSADFSKYTPIHAAASYGRAELLRFLLTYPNVSKDAVNVTDDDGETPLFFCEDVPTAKLLVDEFHADASRKNHEGLTAAENALVNEREAVAEYLRSVTGEEATPRSELLARVGEQDEDEEAEERLEAAEDEEDADDQDLDEKADQLMAHVEEIMRESEANGTDPSDKLREVVGASLMKQIMEGYQR